MMRLVFCLLFLTACGPLEEEVVGDPDIYLQDGTPCWVVKYSHGHVGLKCKGKP